jgi:predicted nucleic acid-binding protein
MFERAVINAGPLVALTLLDQLDLLPQLYKECWIPKTVYHEVAIAGLGKPGAMALQRVDWLDRIRLSPPPDPLLVMELDAGEAEVISLARNLAPCLAVIDERRGRRIAQDVYGLPVKGTAGILVEAQRKGLISTVRPSLLKLKSVGYFISDNVINAACQAVGE